MVKKPINAAQFEIKSTYCCWCIEIKYECGLKNLLSVVWEKFRLFQSIISFNLKNPNAFEFFVCKKRNSGLFSSLFPASYTLCE